MYLVFNIGGTNTRLAVSHDGQSLDEVKVFETLKNYDQQVSLLKLEGNKLLAGEKAISVCGGIAGIWQKDKSKLYKSPHLPDFDDKPIKKDLEEIFGTSVFLGNDVEMEGLGEANLGAGRRSNPVAFLAVGTGIGGVKIENGQVSNCSYGFEPGHMILGFEDNVTYFEELASGSALETMFGKPAQDIDDPEVWKQITLILGIGLHNLIVLWSPEMIILGGSVIKKINLEELKTILSNQLKVFPKIPIVTTGELGDKAGLYGSLLICNRNRFG